MGGDKVIFLIGLLMIVIPMVLVVGFVSLKTIGIGLLWGVGWFLATIWVMFAIFLMSGAQSGWPF